MLSDIQILLDDDDSNAALDKLIDQGNDLGCTPPKPAEFGDDKRIEIAELFQQLVDSALLAGLARRDGELDKLIHLEVFPSGILQNLQLLIIQLQLVGRSSKIGDSSSLICLSSHLT